MTNDPNKLAEFAYEVFEFDHTYYFSDDHRIWKSGEFEKERLCEQAKTMNLSVGDKMFMIQCFENLWNDNRYRETDDTWNLIDANHRMWPYKASMYSIINVTKEDAMFFPINNNNERVS